MRPWVALLVLAAPALLSCDPSATALADRQELARLTQAIDAVREAPHRLKGGELERLRALECKKSCELLRLCADAYALHVAAGQRVEELRRQKAIGGRGPSAAVETELRAEAARAHERVGACTRAELEWRRRFKL